MLPEGYPLRAGCDFTARMSLCMDTLTATLHPQWVGKEGTGYRYHVEFDGKIVVAETPVPRMRSRPRALLARGYSGKVTLLDGKAGKPAPSSTSRRQRS